LQLYYEYPQKSRNYIMHMNYIMYVNHMKMCGLSHPALNSIGNCNQLQIVVDPTLLYS